MYKYLITYLFEILNKTYKTLKTFMNLPTDTVQGSIPQVQTNSL